MARALAPGHGSRLRWAHLGSLRGARCHPLLGSFCIQGFSGQPKAAARSTIPVLAHPPSSSLLGARGSAKQQRPEPRRGAEGRRNPLGGAGWGRGRLAAWCWGLGAAPGVRVVPWAPWCSPPTPSRAVGDAWLCCGDTSPGRKGRAKLPLVVCPSCCPAWQAVALFGNKRPRGGPRGSCLANRLVGRGIL